VNGDLISSRKYAADPQENYFFRRTLVSDGLGLLNGSIKERHRFSGQALVVREYFS